MINFASQRNVLIDKNIVALFDQFSEDIKSAMKSRDKVRLETLRNIKKVFLEAKMAPGANNTLADADALKIISKMAKQGKETAAPDYNFLQDPTYAKLLFELCLPLWMSYSHPWRWATMCSCSLSAVSSASPKIPEPISRRRPQAMTTIRNLAL